MYSTYFVWHFDLLFLHEKITVQGILNIVTQKILGNACSAFHNERDGQKLCPPYLPVGG